MWIGWLYWSPEVGVVLKSTSCNLNVSGRADVLFPTRGSSYYNNLFGLIHGIPQHWSANTGIRNACNTGIVVQ